MHSEFLSIDHMVKKGYIKINRIDQLVKGGRVMDDVYQRVPDDKREKIFQATMNEFTLHSYDKASTNQIIQDAGISKGLLFHYFQSKKELYLATFDRCLNRFMERFSPFLQDLPTDFFDRLLYLRKAKLSLFYEEPPVYTFLITAYEEIQRRFPEAFYKRIDSLVKMNMPLFLESLDLTSFRTDIDHQKAIELIHLGFEALGQQMMKQALSEPDKGLASWEEKIEEFNLLVEIFRHGVYRKEE